MIIKYSFIHELCEVWYPLGPRESSRIETNARIIVGRNCVKFAVFLTVN